MREYQLKYGCNPNQQPARIYRADGGALPFEVLNGRPGYINFLDAFNAWQLVQALKQMTGLAAAASFKHVSPAGTALGLPLGERLKKACFVDDLAGLDDSPVACAYARARSADRLSSFGDFIALSDPCDVVCAELIAREVSDGIIAPAYDPEALMILCGKRKGGYAIIQMDPGYAPPEMEERQVFGLVFAQRFNDAQIHEDLLRQVVTRHKMLPEDARRDLLLSLATLKYTQSNAVCLSLDGQAIGIGAGQQSRVHCVRLACGKADLWHLRQHEKTLNLPFLPSVGRPARDNAVEAYIQQGAAAFSQGRWQGLFSQEPEDFTQEEQEACIAACRGASLASDAFFPFEDSILRAHDSGVSFVAQPGGSVRDQEVIDCCDRLGMTMALTGLRLFHH
ncbi:MAG TPA: phosphoribosylaminoimidazolecarboxamide formyltransferase [Clostridia bacterium]|jgi:AICAR transformylase/IMP cyclohydrolase PurH|nr:phosphoribosylaminoimidazolecarboxamide formyltransferase [Clostridia bacterium]HPY43824.1 phosphoribosylaminoimidazolecarboxamide formyltransferase [Clostridia bacterium]HQA97530.1 phosphoribosylaminoimidazolecarboxamide formyltransferase [Clostridia bacterium]HQO54929.1 phosphoribosylaminoimidazolecarboxamide formyltransferase [Clostridia bacterium]